MSAQFYISPLNESHCDAVWEIAKLSFDTPWSREDFENFLAHASAHHLGVVENGILLAYILCLDVLGDLDTLSIATLPSARRRGLGRALLEALKANPKVKSVFLDVDVANLPAIALYERSGFKRMGVRKKYYASLQDALQMRWTRL